MDLSKYNIRPASEGIKRAMWGKKTRVIMKMKPGEIADIEVKDMPGFRSAARRCGVRVRAYWNPETRKYELLRLDEIPTTVTA